MRSIGQIVAGSVRFGRRTASRAVGSLVSYEAMVPLLRGVCSSPVMQATILARGTSHLQRVDQSADNGVARTRFLLNSFGREWRLANLARQQGQPAGSWFTVQGLEHFEHASRRGPVLLLSSHFGTPRATPVLLARRGYQLLSLEAWGNNYAAIDPAVRANIDVQVMRGRSAFPARSTLAARRHLAAGGIVHTTGDGRLGRADTIVSFCGRPYEFRSTFAAIAVDAGAAVVPVFAPVDERGHLRVQFLEEFDPGPQTAPRQDRIASLVRQYVFELERRWLSDPGNVHRYLWEHYLATSIAEASLNRAG